jgi:hypothetical protein
MIRPEFAAGLSELERAYQDLDGDGIPDRMTFEDAEIDRSGVSPDYDSMGEEPEEPGFLARTGQNIANAVLPYVLPMADDSDSATMRTLRGDIPGAVRRNVEDAASVMTPEGLEAGVAGAVSPFKSFLPPQMAADVEISAEKNPTAATIGTFVAGGPILRGTSAAARGFQALSRPAQFATAAGVGMVANSDTVRAQTAEDELIPVGDLRDMSREDIAKIQTKLRNAGLYDGSIDGVAYTSRGEGNTVRAARRWNNNIRKMNDPAARARIANETAEAEFAREQRRKEAEAERKRKAAEAALRLENERKAAEAAREKQAAAEETRRAEEDRRSRIRRISEGRQRIAEKGGVSEYTPYIAFGLGGLAGLGGQGLKYGIRAGEKYRIARSIRGAGDRAKALSMDKKGNLRVPGARKQSDRAADAMMGQRYGTGKTLFTASGTKYKPDGSMDDKLFAPRDSDRMFSTTDKAVYGGVGGMIVAQEAYKSSQMEEYKANMKEFQRTGDEGYLERADQNLANVKTMDNTMKAELGALTGYSIGKFFPKPDRFPADPKPRLRDKWLRPDVYKADAKAYSAGRAGEDVATLRGEIEAGRQYFQGRNALAEPTRSSVLDRLLGRGVRAERTPIPPPVPAQGRGGPGGSGPTAGSQGAKTGSSPSGQRQSGSSGKTSNRAGSGEGDRIFLRKRIAESRKYDKVIDAGVLTRQLNTDRKLRGLGPVKKEAVQKKLDTLKRYEANLGRKLTDKELRNLPDAGGMPSKYGRSALPAVAGGALATGATMSNDNVIVPGISVQFDDRVGRYRGENGRFTRSE